MNTSIQYDYDLSFLVALAVGAEPARCWRNAALAVLLLPRLLTEGRYIEGWAVVPKEKEIEIQEHGWIVSGNRIVDPSIVLKEKPTQPVFYFPGRELSGDQLYRALPGSTLPLVCHSTHGDDGMLHPEYKKAYEKAWQTAQELAGENQFSPKPIVVRGRDTRRGFTVLHREERTSTDADINGH